MHELPPPLPPGIDSPPLQPSESKAYRCAVSPLNELAKSILAIVIVVAFVTIGFYLVWQENNPRGFAIEEFVEMLKIFSIMALHGWLVVWTALGTANVVIRILASTALHAACLLSFDAGDTANFTVAFILITMYVAILRALRWRITRAQKLVVSLSTTTVEGGIRDSQENRALSNFILIPRKSSSTLIDSFARWHLHRLSTASTKLDAFRPAQFHLKQLFSVTCFVAFAFLAIRLIVYYMSRQFASANSSEMILISACIEAPIIGTLLIVAMWCALGRRRIFVKYTILLIVTFASYFLYNFLSSLEVINLQVDFELSLIGTRDTALAFFVPSTFMVLARGFGYRLIRLPLSADAEKYEIIH